MFEFIRKIATAFAIAAAMGGALILGDIGTASAFNTMHGRTDVTLSTGTGTDAGYHNGHGYPGGHGGCSW